MTGKIVVSEVNDHVVRLSLLQRDFHWHSHSKSSGGNGELTVLADPTLVFDEVRFVVPEQFDYKNWSEYAVASLSINVPEPATLLLLGFGILGIAGLRRKS